MPNPPRSPTDDWPECIRCDAEFPPERKALGYLTCTACGSPRNKYTVACVHKSNYVLVADPKLLKFMTTKASGVDEREDR